MKFMTAYDSTDDHPGLACPEDESRTIQSQAEDADINVIVKRFKLTGELPKSPIKIPLNIDFREAEQFDLGAALRFVRDAEAAFMQYPADLRGRFENDPEKFIAFVENPDNFDECVKLGLLPKKPEVKAPEPMLVRVVPEEPKATK